MHSSVQFFAVMYNPYESCIILNILHKAVRWLLDFQTVNKDSISLVKLDTPKNITKPAMESKISRYEFKKGAHDARFNTGILMKVFRKFMKC